MRLAPRRWDQWACIQDHDCEAWESAWLGDQRFEVVRLGAGEPIVLIPGLAGGWKLLTPLARILARRHRVILIGFSSDRRPARGEADERPLEHAAQLARILANLGIERPTVLGLSFGGAVALELASQFPQSVGALAVMGSEARFQAGLGARILQRVLERYPLPADNGFVNQFFNLLHGGRPEPGPLPRFTVESCWETDQGVIARRIKALESFDVSDRLWRIDVPTLVLAGSRDVVVAPSHQRALADAISGARFATIEGGGHVGFLTHRQDVAREVAQLVRRRSRQYH
jgi:3-oxoadipate enol-lactonase